MTNSTALITDMQTAITTGPSAASTALAIAASGQIMDLPGTLQIIQLKLKEAAVLLTAVLANDIDGSDGIKAGLTSVNNVLK